MQDPIAYIHAGRWSDLPCDVQERAQMCLLDLIGVAAGAHHLTISEIIRTHAAQTHPGRLPLWFDGRGVSRPGLALATAMQIDGLDGHDGYNPSKGHIGCPMMPAAFAAAADLLAEDRPVTGAHFLAALVMGYEFGARAAEAQHASAPDYHTSGSWGAVAAAAAIARLEGVDAQTTRHSLGIAEYYGPRSQMMRCIDAPSMVKDGAGWGAMTGVEAASLAKSGFTGAPALIVEQVKEPWADLGQRWAILEQYFKPYPICRWAQPPVEALLDLRRAHGLQARDVAQIRVETFHESIRLATRRPKTTEEAQYSTSFPCAAAMVHGTIAPQHLMGTALQDPEVLRLSDTMTFAEHDDANAAFPLRRFARVSLTLQGGQVLESRWHEPKWDHTSPPSYEEIAAKYHALTDPLLGSRRAQALRQTVEDLPMRGLESLISELAAPA